MSHFVPLSPTAHQGYAWLKSNDFSSMADQGAINLVAQELPHALATMPLGFRQLENGDFELVAVCALSDRQNLFINAEGRWVAGYRPALLRTYPFLLQKNSDHQHVLCVDEDSGLLVDAKNGGEPLFDESGNLEKQITQIMQFLTKWEQQRRITQKAVDMLVSFGLVIPWNVKMEDPSGQTLPGLTGYYRIDEKALNALPEKHLAALRHVGALTIAYAQLFSQHRLDVLTRLYRMHQNTMQKNVAEPDLESLFDSGDDSISFDFDS